MAIFIEKQYGYWQLKGDLKRLLLECRSAFTTRYAINGIQINGIHIEEGKLVATDGWRLVEIEYNHEIPSGNYFATSDGYLLDKLEGKFPKYRDIIPDKKQLRQIVKTSGMGEAVIGLILGKLCHAGCICRLNLYERPVKILTKIIAGEIRVYVDKKEPAEHLFLIEAETTIGNIKYVQMPVTTKNEIET